MKRPVFALFLALLLAGPAGAADRQVLFGDAFRLVTSDSAPFDRLADGRLACLSEACAGKTVVMAGVSVHVGARVTAKQVASASPAYRAPRDFAVSTGNETAFLVLFSLAGLLVALAAGLALVELRRQRGEEPVDRLRRALRLLRESAIRPPEDRRRALDHLAATLENAPPAERAIRLAWARPDPAPAAALDLADEVGP